MNHRREVTVTKFVQHQNVLQESFMLLPTQHVVGADARYIYIANDPEDNTP